MSKAKRLEVPREVAAVLDALHFSGERLDGIRALTDAEWHRALAYCDRNQLTLVLARVAERSMIPRWVRDRLDANALCNRDRLLRSLNLYRELRAKFEDEVLDHLVLKGFTHWPDFTPDASARQQYDLDLFFRDADIERAKAVVTTLSYEPIQQSKRLPTDHLPTMIRKTGWQWRGDFFDPEIPIAIELHFRFWDRGTERFGPSQLDGFWQRREQRTLLEQPFACLWAPDALAYASLHALRHLLRGDARPVHVYEIAWFLQNHQDEDFWRDWSELHDRSLQQVQAICFALAREWFGCRLAATPQKAMYALPQPVTYWMAHSAHAALESQFRPNKDELWLHLALLSSARDKLAIIRRRIVPLSLPGPVDAVHLPDSEKTLRVRIRARWRYVKHIAARTIHHLRTLGSLVAAAPRWWSGANGLSSHFWLFLCCAAIFNFGVFVFFLFYNLYLLDLRFAEDAVGLITAASTAGSIAGSLLAGAMVSRAGLRTSLVTCFCATALLLTGRILATSFPTLLVAGFLAGISLCVWFVCVPLVTTQLTTERNRPLGFSLTLGSGIATGILAGLASGKLAALLGSKANVLFFGCTLTLLALVPASRLRLDKPRQERRTFSRNPFLFRFLLVLALWSFATGAFNPFFNVYFSRTFHMGVERIGWLFSAAQFGQVAAILSAPLLLRRLGLVRAVAVTQLATAAALAALAGSPAAAAAALYVAYMAFQYMGEPGMYSLLMNRLTPDERTGASALNFFVLFGMQTVAASLAGFVITEFGYPALLFTAAALALGAAVLVRVLLREPSSESTVPGINPGCN